LRNSSDLKRVANFLNYGWIHGRKALKNDPGMEQLREQLKEDLRPVLRSKVPEDALGTIYQKSVTINPIEVTQNGELVGVLSLNEERMKPGLTRLEFVVNGQPYGQLTVDYKRSPLDEYRVALYRAVWRAIFDRTIGKLRQCGWCEQYFLNKVPRQAYCRSQCKTKAKHEQGKKRVQNWRKNQKKKQAEEQREG
jgi:hypothetical protein